MKVLQYIGLCANKYGGLEKYIVRLAVELSKENSNMEIIYKRGIECDLLLDNLKVADVKHHSMIADYSIKQRYRKIKLIINELNPDIIHLHFANSIEVLLFYIATIFSSKKIKIISTYHCQAYINSFRHYLSSLVINLLSYRILCVSKSTEVELKRFYSANKISTLHLGSPCKRTQSPTLKSSLGICDNKVVICNIAYHDPIKGIDVLIEAVNILKNIMNINNIIVLQIGYELVGPYSQNLKDLVMQYNIESEVKFLGVREDIAELLTISDIYCQPSRSEGVPLSIMEASLCALPVVATNVGGISEVVINDRNGFLCNSGDSKKIAEKLCMLVKSDSLRHSMGTEAKIIAEESFSINKSIDKLLEIYKYTNIT